MARAGLTLEELQGIDPDALTPMFQEQLPLTKRDAAFHEMAIWQDSPASRLENNRKAQQGMDGSHMFAQAQAEQSRAERSQVRGLTPPV